MQFRRERVRVETQRHIIEGTLQLPNEGYRSRTTDFLNAHDSDFIALIDADVIWTDGAREPERQRVHGDLGAPRDPRHRAGVARGRGRARARRGPDAPGGDLDAAVCLGGRVGASAKGASRCDKWPRGGPVCGVRARSFGACGQLTPIVGGNRPPRPTRRSLAWPLRSTAWSRVTSSSLRGSTPRPSATASRSAASISCTAASMPSATARRHLTPERSPPCWPAGPGAVLSHRSAAAALGDHAAVARASGRHRLPGDAATAVSETHRSTNPHPRRHHTPLRHPYHRPGPHPPRPGTRPAQPLPHPSSERGAHPQAHQ